MRLTKLAYDGLNAAFYDFTQDVINALFEAMGVVRARSMEQFPAPPPVLLLRGGYAESPGWFLVQAHEFDPEPLTVEALRVRDVYGSERIVAALLEIMAGEKWLDRSDAGEYYLATEGRAVMERINNRRGRFMSELAALPEDETHELEQLLDRVVGACLASQTPAGAWSLAHSRRRAPGAEALPLERIRQYLEDLNAFRDDAHMAAWRSHGISGYEWEAFSQVCDGQAATADALFDNLAHRGYSRTEYAGALFELARRGWLEAGEAGEAYAVTKAGREVRGAAEKMTDEYFYIPWKALSAQDRHRLQDLLTRMRDNLRSFASSPKESGVGS
jgi:hypothetical protein